MQKFYWIDDNPERSPAAVSMQETLEVKVEFKDIRGKNLEEWLPNLLLSTEPELVILDQNLEEANRGVFKKGSTVAAFIRETWPECPIVCVTGEDLHNFSSIQKTLYEDIYPYSGISNYYNRITSIANSFKLIKEKIPKNLSDIISLLQVPEADSDKLITILPTSLKEDFDDNGIIIEISRWVRDVLVKRPGFLYDKTWLATLIGIKPESFEKVSHYFEEAKYRGVFSNSSDTRWWKSTALQILYDISDIKGLPWHRGRGISGITAADYSICYASGEALPETVAFVDSTKSAEEKPMKIKYTTLHNDFESMLYFEDIRLMAPQE